MIIKGFIAAIFGFFLLMLAGAAFTENSNWLFPEARSQISKCLAANSCEPSECAKNDPAECEIESSCLRKCKNQAVDYSKIKEIAEIISIPYLRLLNFVSKI